MKFFRTRAHQLLVDALAITAGLALAYGIRFEGVPPPSYFNQFWFVLPYLILVRLAVFGFTGVYRLVWRYISVRDVPRILIGMAAGSGMLLIARAALRPLLHAIGIDGTIVTVPLGVLLGELVLSTTGVVGGRVAWRMLTERAVRPLKQPQRKSKYRALLIGAGSAGVMVAREANARRDVGFDIVGFVDDDSRKHGSVIHGYRVLGSTEELDHYAEELGANMAVLTMASVPATDVRRIVELAKQASLQVKIIPGLYEILNGKVSISKVRDVAIEDLLGRAPVTLEQEAISAFITDKTVLITGAGGSIGSEICTQVAHFDPRRILLFEQAENALFHISRKLERQFPELELVPLVGTVLDAARVDDVMCTYRPELVFHAAAHKHVPLMEANPREAIRNNAMGSRVVADLAHKRGVESFVMVSTDKAVNPTSVMGATKRLAEMYIQALARRSKTRFITVRFGNVLASNGSVVPIFREQIARGGPVTVTHPEMKRYFMTIPEASQLVLQAATMGQGGEIFILEMGDAISIVSLARDLIRLSGYTPDEEIKIVYTGTRPGEKLYEEMNLSEENATKTKHPRIWIGQSHAIDVEELRRSIDTLVAMDTSPDGYRNSLQQHVVEYRPNSTPSPASPPADQAAPARDSQQIEYQPAAATSH